VSNLDPFVDATHELLKVCRVEVSTGMAYTNLPPENPTAVIVTREQALLLTSLAEMGNREQLRPILRGLMILQKGDGHWAPRYRQDGRPMEGPGITEATAMGVWALLTYAQVSEDVEFLKAIEVRVRRGLAYLEKHLHPQLGLPRVGADLLPPFDGGGFSLWVASAAAAAFHLAADAYRDRDLDIVYGALRKGIEQHLLRNDRFITRLDSNGYPDFRPTISLLAPALFGIWPEDRDPILSTLDWLYDALFDRRLSGYVPAYSYAPELSGLLPAVWPVATAWLARTLYGAGERERGDKLLRLMLGSTINNQLPQAIISREALQLVLAHREAFIQAQPKHVPRLETEVLLTELEADAQEQRILYVGMPSVASHIETVRAFYRGGYIKSFLLQE